MADVQGEFRGSRPHRDYNPTGHSPRAMTSLHNLTIDRGVRAAGRFHALMVGEGSHRDARVPGRAAPGRFYALMAGRGFAQWVT
jgi:hypothetical protein